MNKTIFKNLKYKSFRSAVLVAGCLILSVTIHAQKVAAVKPGSSTGSYALSGFETINPYSGNLNFSLPLLDIGGRGSASSSIKLNLNQKWSGTFWYWPDDPTGHAWVQDYYNESYALDVNKGYSTGVLLMHRLGGNPNPYCYGATINQSTLTKVTFRAPDGTEYAFRDRATNGQRNVLANCQLNPPSRGTVFDSMDGSSATYIADYAIYDQNYAGGPSTEIAENGYVILPNGTRYRIEAGNVVWMLDKDGNKTTYTYNGNTYIITDALNRQVTIEYGIQDSAPYGLCDRITYKGSGGATRIIRISYKNLSDVLRAGYSIQTRQQLFPDVYGQGACNPNSSEGCGSLITNPQKRSTVWLPDGRSYKFQYNSYAELARVELPTGGVVEYDWVNGFNIGSGIINGVVPLNGYGSFDIYRRVAERRVYDDGTNLTNKLVISGTEPLGNNKGFAIEDLYDSTDQLLSRTKHYYFGINSTVNGPYEFYEPWSNGREYQTDVFGFTGIDLLRRTTSTWDQTPPTWSLAYPDSAPVNNPHVIQATTLLADSNQMSKRTFDYDSKNNLTDTYEYDYGIGAPGLFLRRSHTDYLTTNPVNNLNYTSDNIHILNLPTQSWVSSDTSGNNKISLSKFEYDNYATDSMHAALVDRFNISGHDSNYGTNYTTRGLATKVTSYADAQNQTGAISTYAQYDITGNTVKAIDAKGFAMTLGYADNFGSPDAEARNTLPPSLLSGQQTFAFVTSATNQLGYTGYSQVDYYTGQIVDAEDMNGNVSTTLYNDVLDRPTQTISANNRPAFRKQTSIAYDDLGRKVTVTSDSKTYNDNLIKSESLYDKMGRTTETRQYEDATNYTAAQQQYDSLGRAYKSSNPFRPYQNETPQWTTTSFDSLGRVIQVKTPDNAIVSRSYLGTTTTVTDQALRKRSGTSDALGRLLNVVEDPTGLNYQTNYTYDLLGRLRKTAQTEGTTTQNRYFMYNDLGRLIRAKQVEQNPNSNLPAATDPITENTNWSVSYSYDNSGNITSTTDANNRTITGTYDNLNRLTFRDYSDVSMPDVTFTFDDTNIANSKGQLTAVTSSVSQTKYTAFDELGRIKSSQQITAGQTYTMPNYSYDLSGALVSQTYPSNRVVTTETDNIGRLSRVASQLPNAVQKTMLSNLDYTSFGAVKQAKLGNGKWESAQFDNQRLQIKQIGLGGSAGDTSLLKIEYGYGTATANNGSLMQQKITIPGAANQIIQNYTYDNLNRLSTATETVNSAQQWKQTFSYDRFGNRRFDAANTTTLGSCSQAICNPNINLAKNQLSTSDGYSFDAEGNLTGNPESQLFTYDAENRIKQVQNTATQATANYQYDGQGKRVKKIIGNQETYFVYDAFGKLVAEYTTNQTITQNGTQYLTADALGSPRVVTSAIGGVASRHDYLPFGEEVMAGVGGRTVAQGYGQTDNARQKFTGYERDDESGLDFAQHRYFSSKHGRFTSVDPLTPSVNIRNPQTFNRYSYGLNSPYKFTDSLGLQSQCQGPGGGQGSTLQSCDGADNIGGDDDDCKKNGTGCPPFTVVVGGVGIPGSVGTVIIKIVEEVVKDYGVLTAEFLYEAPLASRPLIPLLLPYVAVPAIILGSATTVNPTNCPSNVCPAGTGPPLPGTEHETDIQTEIQPTTTTEEGPPDISDTSTVVRGGLSPPPAPGVPFSGAFGINLYDASKGVPHGNVSYTTAGAIRANGGRVIYAPEEAYPGGPINYRHVNVTLGPTGPPFIGPVPNPVPKKERIPGRP